MLKVFKPEVCEHCTQPMTYTIGLDRGSARIVKAIIEVIAKKNINEIHPARELDFSGDKKWFLTNLSRPRFHGLIAYIKEKKGYYCLTRKAGKFLRGEPVLKWAVISKVTGHQEGYWSERKVTIGGLLKSDVMWEGDVERFINFLDPIEERQMSLFNNQLVK